MIEIIKEVLATDVDLDLTDEYAEQIALKIVDRIKEEDAKEQAKELGFSTRELPRAEERKETN